MDKVKVLRDVNVWDLHIHTPLGTPQKRNYGKDTTEQFIDHLIEIYKESNYRIGMISFTDHNKINAEAYELFREKTDIAILPGIEVDVFLSEKDKASKHIIFYFDEKELDNISNLKLLIETYISDNSKVIFEDFVMFLAMNNKHFAISPHAFKQDKRGIDYDWFDEEKAHRGANEFTGLIFPFWEAAGKTDICKAIDFLNEQYQESENRQAVIAFSDSADYKKISDYMNCPHQFFRCLNSFRGLLLAGSDPDRVVYDSEKRPETNPSEKIKSIIFSDDLQKLKKTNQKEVELSDRLNVIVGGRGKGKSALLEAIVLTLDESKVEERSRKDFVRNFHVQLTNFKGARMPSDTRFLYFSQSYISKLFNGESQTKLEAFFQKEFDNNKGITDSISDLISQLEKIDLSESIDDLNINDDLKKLVTLKGESERLSVKRKTEKYIQLHTDDNKNYFQAIMGVLPSDKLLWDDELNDCLNEFTNLLVKKIAVHNYEQLLGAHYANLMKKNIEDAKKIQNKDNKNKIESRRKIEQKLRFLYGKELTRIREINRLYEVDEKITSMRMKEYVANGEGNNRFYFISVSNKEHPVEYARRIIVEAVNKAKRKKFDKKSIEEIFLQYATSNDLCEVLKDTVELESIEENIKNIKHIRSEKVQKIVYVHDGEYTDLHMTSPGTQTNAVMEYILHSESTIPLLIDQPEDNIDNEARYSQLTKWIRKQKYNRQIILVTHDANIVINGDAENVIIADRSYDKFIYEYGALEYGDILERAAVILDGGKTAIHRRIEKYGE